MVRETSSTCYAREQLRTDSRAVSLALRSILGALLILNRQHPRPLAPGPNRSHWELALSMLRPSQRILACHCVCWGLRPGIAGVGEVIVKPCWVNTGRVHRLPTLTSPSIPEYCCPLRQMYPHLGTCWNRHFGFSDPSRLCRESGSSCTSESFLSLHLGWA